MSFTVRAGRIEDVPLIAPWTSDTFDWGDYVPDRLVSWIEDPGSEVFVCVDEHDVPIAVSHAVMLSATEGWLEGARVHRDYRRSGMGSAMNRAGIAWAADRGAKVVRLATDASNTPARRQVEDLGYRLTSSWAHANISVDPTRRSEDPDRLRPAPSSDVDAAWMFWAAGDLAQAARDLIPQGWRWRKGQPDDLLNAARAGSFYQTPAGWVIVEQPGEDWMRSTWMATTDDHALSLLDGVHDLAAGTPGVEEVSVMVPNLPWTWEALTRAGATPQEEVVYTIKV